jgi:hypothetical protein
MERQQLNTMTGFFQGLLLWLLLTSLLFFANTLLYQDAKNRLEAQMRLDQKSALSESKAALQQAVNWLLRDLDLLESNIPHPVLTDNNTDEARRLLDAYFVQFMKTRPNLYDQIRFIDLAGDDVARVDWSTQGPIIVEKSSLQNKFARYYVQESLLLSEHSLFIATRPKRRTWADRIPSQPRDSNCHARF